jgi:hypothetical protein
MIVRKESSGGITLEFTRPEASTLRLLAQRASFMDTPPEDQDRIFRMAEEILAALEDGAD